MTQERTFNAHNPATGEALDPRFPVSGPDDIDRATAVAEQAVPILAGMPGVRRSELLANIAMRLENLRDQIVRRAGAETALPEPRLTSELARTCFQLRMFADLVREGSWVDARIDHGDPGRTPLPKPDVRSMLRPLGPVAVFGSGNFPLAFSVAGGDTASALAAGCPVIVKAHPAHPGTSALVAGAIEASVKERSFPDGTFSILFDDGFDVGTALVRHPRIRAVGFTGSRKGGVALVEVASQRPIPIPVFAEMGSTNPVFLLPGALESRGEEIAGGLQASVTLGVGQFCTNPGLVFVIDGSGTAAFIRTLSDRMAGSAAGTMLTSGICRMYNDGVDRIAATPGVTERARVRSDASNAGGAGLYETDATTFLSHRGLAEEVFGPSTLIVRCGSMEQMRTVASSLEGQLTASVHGTEKELAGTRDLIAILECTAGRVLINGFPTGVEVGHAMVHGGPFPATSDGRSTSVGTRAIHRFVRAVCYQGFPDGLLPDELREGNPLKITRIVDGKTQVGAV